MKTKEELNILKEEYENVTKKLAELNEEELEQIAGGLIPIPYVYESIGGKTVAEVAPTADEIIEELRS